MRRKRRFALVWQHDSMECGIACMAMICRHYGKRYSLCTLSQKCFASREGISLKALSDVADELGLENVATKVTLGQLSEFPLPAILHWNQNHFVVLYKISGNGQYFHIADPGKGKVKYTAEDMAKHWIATKSQGADKGIAMFFEPTDRFGKSLEEESEKRSFKFLLGYLRQYSKYFVQIIIGLFLGCVLQLVLPFLTQSIVDIGIANKNIGFIWLILLGQLMIVAGRTATDFIRSWLLLHISMRINISLVSDFFIKLLKLPMSFFDTKLTGDLMQRMSDHARVQSFLTKDTLNIVFSVLSFVVFGIVLMIYSRLIFFVFAVGSVLYGVWIAAFLRKRKLLDYETFNFQAQNQNKTFQFITSIQEIKLQGCEQRRRWEWEDVQADLFGVQLKALKLQQAEKVGSIFINEAKNILITIFAATAVINGQITLGAMLAIQYIVGQLNSPIEQMMSFIYSVQDVRISLERINEIHTSRNEENSGMWLAEFASTKRSIKLRNVVFKYDPHALRKTIDNVSFEIPEGKVTAIVGASGSGKTTLIKLMLGYYPVAAGQILISDRNINDYNLRWWRRQCGVVMQDGVIFSETIARNIAVADGDIDVDKLEKAARIACIHDYVMSLPLKYDTKIGRDGVGISQGQRQRILIARAVYKQPEFILLDEATNSLDAANEKAIVDNLVDFYRGRTVVVVAHRLSTVKNANQIIVIEGGQVVEKGTHAELIAMNGAYFNLVKNQLELGG